MSFHYHSTIALRLFFFFQAEDGIRDFHVTGVKTCALPIWVQSRVECRCAAPVRHGLIVTGRRQSECRCTQGSLLARLNVLCADIALSRPASDDMETPLIYGAHGQGMGE